MPGFTVGILAQEPRLNEDKTVLGNVEEGVAETKKLLDEYNEIAEKMATDYSDELMEQMSKLTEQIEHKDAWDLDSQLEQAMDALRCPPPDADVKTLSGGEKQQGRPLQAAPAAARPAAARRAHQPPRRGVRAVARAAPGEVRRHRHRGHPRPVLHGERGAVDPRARPRPRLPLRGQLLHLPGDEGLPPQGRGRQGRQDAQAPRRRARVGQVKRPRPPDQVQGAARPVRGDGRRGGQEPEAGLRGDPDPAGPAARQHGGRGRAPDQGLRRPRALRRPVLHPAAQRHRRRHRPERRRQDHAVQDDHRRGEAGRRHDPRRRHGHDLLLRPEPRRARPEQERLAGHLRRRDVHPRRQRGVPQPRVRGGVRLQGRRTSRSRPASCPAASATG